MNFFSPQWCHFLGGGGGGGGDVWLTILTTSNYLYPVIFTLPGALVWKELPNTQMSGIV